MHQILICGKFITHRKKANQAEQRPVDFFSILVEITQNHDIYCQNSLGSYASYF